MGRKKLAIKRLECLPARQTTYSKRKVGILKKAKELSVLCDVDLALIMFSPAGKPSLFVGHNKELLSVVDKLSRISVDDRERRRSDYTTKILKKIYSKTDVDIRNFSLDKSDYLMVKQNDLKELEEKIAEKTKILNEWKNPENIMNLNKIQYMENHLMISLENLRAKKRELILQAQQQLEENVQAPQVQDLQQQQQQIAHDFEVLLEMEDLLM